MSLSQMKMHKQKEQSVTTPLCQQTDHGGCSDIPSIAVLFRFVSLFFIVVTMGKSEEVIEPLHMANYKTWRVKMPDVLILGCQKATEGPDCEPDVNQKTLSLIQLNIKERHFPLFLKFQTTKDLQSTLESIYNAKSTAKFEKETFILEKDA